MIQQQSGEMKENSIREDVDVADDTDADSVLWHLFVYIVYSSFLGLLVYVIVMRLLNVVAGTEVVECVCVWDRVISDGQTIKYFYSNFTIISDNVMVILQPFAGSKSSR